MFVYRETRQSIVRGSGAFLLVPSPASPSTCKKAAEKLAWMDPFPPLYIRDDDNNDLQGYL